MKRQPRSSLRHRPPDHRPAPQPAWTTWRTGDAESSQGPCDTHGPQAGSGSRLEAARIGRSFGEGQPLMGQDCQPSLPSGAEELFCVSSGDRSLHASLGLWISSPTALRSRCRCALAVRCCVKFILYLQYVWSYARYGVRPACRVRVRTYGAYTYSIIH